MAAKRRTLPLGGEIKEDYVFQWANDGKVGKKVKLSELVEGKNTPLLYSFMFGPNWDNPCYSGQITHSGAALTAIAKAPADRINA